MAVTRRLAAVLVADVVGYSRLMERDETATHERMRALFNDVIFPGVAAHGGRTVKTTGDGMLLEFASATAALRFALGMQRDVAVRNEGVPAGDVIAFRIGINLGEIIVDGDDIAGDGVNVAARLEPLADAGGICVSAAVREQVRENLGVTFVDAGDKRVKNISKPIRVFKVALPGAGPAAVRTRVPRRALLAAAAALVLAGILVAAWRVVPWSPAASGAADALLVLPFTTQATDPDVVAATRTFGADVAGMLANSVREASVVAASAADGREPGTRYVLTGEVRTANGDVVVATRLVDTATRKQLASEQRRIERARLVSERDLLVARTTAAARQMLQSAEAQRLVAGGGSDARSLVARATAMQRGDLASIRAARKVYDEAIERDPSLVAAWLGRLYTFDAEYWLDLAAGRNDAVVAAMDRDSLRVLDIDGRDPRAWFGRQVALEAQWKWEAALEANARGQALDPSRFAEPVLLLILAGRPQEALERIDRRNAAVGKSDPAMLFAACNALVHLGRYADARAQCERAQAEGGDYWSHLSLVAVYEHTGDHARAVAAKDQLLRNAPDFTITRLLAKRFSDSPVWEEGIRTRFVPAWRAAGVPE